jgi:hypothetical protein
MEDDPARRAVVEAMLVSIFGNAFSVIRDGQWLGTFPDQETAERWWGKSGPRPHEGGTG